MKFIASELSPYGFRVRLACRLKNLEIAFEPPPGASGSVERRELTPFARFPILLNDGGTVIAESLALLEYLEDAGVGTRSLRPSNRVQLARVRMISLLFDGHVVTALGGVFKQVMHHTPDVDAVSVAFNDVEGALIKLVHFFDQDGPAVGNSISIADCAMVPFAFLVETFAQRFGVAPMSSRVPRFGNWWRYISAVPEVAEVLAQHREALEAMMAAKPQAVPPGA